MTITEKDLKESSAHLSADETAVEILDQTQLPNHTVWLSLQTAQEVYDAIKSLAVRGAPAIGICAGYAMYVLAQQAEKTCVDRQSYLDTLRAQGDYLVSSRPTAVNLSWAVERMMKTALSHPELDNRQLTALLGEESKAIHREDIEMCYRIAENGLSLVKDGDGILTHCNAGELATSKYGTATGPVYLAKERGMNLKVFSDETRPLLQGARLTSYELHKRGVDVTLICDNMASIVMKNGWVQACFVGCDRIAANGDFANKIGTSGVAILAKHYGIPFYTLGPRSTIDINCPTGADIPIELRDPDEIRSMWYKEPMAPADVKCYNPAFDVTDHSPLTAIVTDRGVIYPPFEENLRKIVSGEIKVDSTRK